MRNFFYILLLIAGSYFYQSAQRESGLFNAYSQEDDDELFEALKIADLNQANASGLASNTPEELEQSFSVSETISGLTEDMHVGSKNPVERRRARLQRLARAKNLVVGTGMGHLTTTTESITRDVVTVSIARAGDLLKVKCTVTTAVVSSGSNAKSVCKFPNSTGFPETDRASGAIAAFIANEHIDSSTQNRPYNTRAVAQSVIETMRKSQQMMAAEQLG